MKLRAHKPWPRIVLALLLVVAVTSFAQTDQPPKNAPEPTVKGAEKQKSGPAMPKSKQPKDTGDPTLPPKTRKAKEIPFPVPVGRDANLLKVPSYDQVGKLLSVLKATKATRIDNEHVQMDGMTFDMNQADGKDAYKVEMPTSVLDLKTNIITSEHAVSIRTKDFELTGERVKFDTVERTGELLGHVHMRIYNLKQIATPGQPSTDF